MNWGSITVVFFTSFVKFMFAPFAASKLNLDFLTSWVSVFAGGVVSATIFYFASEYFMKLNHTKKAKKMAEAERTGKPYKMKKSFTRINKALVRFKHSTGQKGICLFAPLFLSVPVGSIICAKFFGKLKTTFPLILIGLAMNGFILCFFAFITDFI